MDNDKDFIKTLDDCVENEFIAVGDYKDIYKKVDLGAKLKYQEIINNYFKVGAKQPLKKLLADINNAAGKDTLRSITIDNHLK